MPAPVDHSLAALPYEPAALGIGAAHIGVGAFHRGHQQSYYDDLARAGARDWGVLGLNLAPPDIAAAHARQAGVYGVLTDDGAERALRRVGTLRRVDMAPDPLDPAWDAISFVTLTITEKGYCNVVGETRLDLGSAIAADLETPEAPKTAIGFLCKMLERRRRAGLGGINLVSCDNVAANGTLLKSAVSEFAARAWPELTGWLASHVAFPNTMVDRIVPAMDAAAADRLAEAMAAPDDLGVVAEPFRQWVIEDRFAAPRPPLETVGVDVVADVAVFEHMKHRMLNGLQSALAELGRLSGFEISQEAASDPGLIAWAKCFLRQQAETLVAPPGQDLDAYAETSLRRLQNPMIRHGLNQIATDASFKLQQRVFQPAAWLVERGLRPDLHAAVTAGWIVQAGGQDADGSGVVVRDPGAARVARLRDQAGGAHQIADAVIRPPLFPAVLSGSAEFRGCVARWVDLFRDTRDPRAIRKHLAESAEGHAHA